MGLSHRLSLSTTAAHMLALCTLQTEGPTFLFHPRTIDYIVDSTDIQRSERLWDCQING